MSSPRQSRMTGSRLVLLASAVLLALALVCFIGYANLPASRHYQLFGDVESLYLGLSQMESNATLIDLEAQLGPAEALEESWRQKLIEGYEANLTKHPGIYPDGVTDHDQFIKYSSGDNGITLQIRDGKLVNFTPADFREGPQQINMLNK